MTAYLDNASTTRVCEEAARAAYETMTENYGNPSSGHNLGRAAGAALKAARQKVSSALGAEPDELFFTSGGTESDNWAVINGALHMKRRGRHIISSAAEHDAVLKSLEVLESMGFNVTRLSPGGDGSVSAESVVAALREDTVLLSLMYVNNETGAVTDISAISKALKRAGSSALLHTDAVQAFLKIPFSAARLGADMISVSGHKIHAPKGVGALYLRRGLNLKPFLVGGAQEDSRRAGTEPMPQICAFGEAAKIGFDSLESSDKHVRSLRVLALGRLSAEIPELVVIGGGAPHILNISIPGYQSEVLMSFLEARGVCVSRSSACKKGGRSHVLKAMGLSPEIIDGALRISFSRYTAAEEVHHLCNSLCDAVKTLLTASNKSHFSV